ncbi:MAG: CRISPR-associated protein Cas4 [Caldilineaceae bacterium]
MITEYTPEDLLPLSGIQHFLFCRRQWALIHVERQWQENALTVEGKILHERADDPFFTDKRKGVIVARAVPVASRTLGLSGVCDVVEFTESAEGVRLPGHAGTFLAAPVEYKRGKQKQEPSDEAQLCAQALCLEEMLTVSIPTGYLYYGQTRRRVAVNLNAALREQVRKAAQEMHAYMQRGYTPKVKPFKGCRSCSLADVCLPNLQREVTPASTYIAQQIERT